MSKSQVAKAPTVSVIIPAYRASADIADALASVFAQTFVSYEVIVIDDGSPDAVDLKAAMEPYRSRLYCIEQPNRGPGAARNAGIRASRGKLIAFLDADDRWAPQFLARQIAFLEGTESCAMVYCDALLSGETAARRQAVHGDCAVKGRGHAGQPDPAGVQHRVVDRGGAARAAHGGRPVRRDAAARAGLRVVAAPRAAAARRCATSATCSRSAACAPAACRAMPSPRSSRALNVLDRFGRAHTLEGVARTALRIRMMALVDRLEIEQAKQRIVEGNFAAARYHLNAAHERGEAASGADGTADRAQADARRLPLAASVAVEGFAGAGALTRRLAPSSWADDRRATAASRAL